MNTPLASILLSLVATLSWGGAQNSAPKALQSEIDSVNAMVANVDLKLAVVACMAEDLGVHRNHLLLLRRETGKSLAEIYIDELRSRGDDDQSVLTKLKALRQSWARESAGSVSRFRWRPVAQATISGDHSSAADLVAIAPEVGIDSSRYAVVLGVPAYFVSSASQSSGGIGDVYVTGFLRGRAGHIDLGSALTIGAPTGDRNKGLGTGKVAVDATGTVSRRVERTKFWASAGFANSVFSNVGYVRPYTIDGTSAHVSAGADANLGRHFTAGLAGFALLPFGDQVVYSESVTAATTPTPSGGSGGGMMPGGGMGGHGSGGGMTMPPTGTTAGMPFYAAAQRSVVAASEVRDFGGSAWLSARLHSGVTFTTGVSYSVAFHFAVIHSGIGIDAVSLLKGHLFR